MHNLPHVPNPLHPLLLPTEFPGFGNSPDAQIMWWGKAVGFSHCKNKLEGVSESLKTRWLWPRLSSPLILFSFIISISEIFPGDIYGSFCVAFHVPLNIACAIIPQGPIV